MALPVDVIVEHGHRAVAFVRHGDLARTAKRHGPVTIPGPSERAVTDDHGIEVSLVTVAYAEEIAQGDVHTRRLPAVVIHAQAEEAGPGKLVIRHGEPDVAHHAGSAEVRHHVGLPGHDALAVVVAAHEPVPAGDPSGGKGLHAGEIEQIERASNRDLGGRAAREQKEEATRSHRPALYRPPISAARPARLY